MAKRMRIMVLFGGRSGEHEVSLVSAESVMRNLDQEKYEVVPVGITREGRWLVNGDPLAALRSGVEGQSVPAALPADPSHRALVPIAHPLAAEDRTAMAGSGVAPLSLPPGPIDVVFPVLHGTYGEDGTVQGLLELADIPYVGAGVLGSALGMDKAVQKTLWRAHGLPVVEHMVLRRSRWEREPATVLDEVEATVGFPCFTKPANLGSSVGISKVRNRMELADGLTEAASYDSKLLVERAVDARELECSVLGNDDPVASVVGEVVPCREFYDYRAKYVEEGSQLIIPAQVPASIADEVRRLAVAAFKAIECAGMARVDFFLDRRTGQLFLNEINTIPGFTPISMYPKLWEATGLSYPQLLDRLIELAIERHEEKRRNRTTYQY